MRRSPAAGALKPLVAPARTPPRLTHLELPPYRHVPGLTPHPVTDPRGHLYGKGEWLEMPSSVRLPEDWRACEPYLLGVDLFNRAYLWEAHEAWEVGWNAAGHVSAPGLFLQGLIQAAAALLQRHRGIAGGAATLGRKAAARLAWTAERSAAERGYMGLDVGRWRLDLLAALGERGRYPILELTDF